MFFNKNYVNVTVQPANGPDFNVSISFEKRDNLKSMETYQKVVNVDDLRGALDFWHKTAKQNRKVKQCKKYVDYLVQFLDTNDLIKYKNLPEKYENWLESNGLDVEGEDYSYIYNDSNFQKFVCDYIFENAKNWLENNDIYRNMEGYTSCRHYLNFKQHIRDNLFEAANFWVWKSRKITAKELLDEFDSYNGYWYYKAYFDFALRLNQIIIFNAETAYYEDDDEEEDEEDW